MYAVNISKKKFDSLTPLEIDKTVINSEAVLYKFNYKGKEKVFKNLHRLKGSIFANKLYTIEMLSSNQMYLPSSFTIPESLGMVNGNIEGFIVDFIQGINLQALLNNPKIDSNIKLYYLSLIGNILEQLKHIRNNNEIEGIYLNDLHAGNFIVTPNNELKVVDLDSCKICDNKPFPSKYLTSERGLFNYSNKYQVYQKDKPKEYLSELGYIDADENSDLYCYIITIMNFLYGKNLNNMSMDEFYKYLNYLSSIGISKRLIDCFEKIVLNCDNKNPKGYIEKITQEQVAKANYKVFELKNNK